MSINRPCRGYYGSAPKFPTLRHRGQSLQGGMKTLMVGTAISSASAEPLWPEFKDNVDGVSVICWNPRSGHRPPVA
jgi:hypothetical protein